MISSTINGSLDLVGRQPDRALQYVMVMESTVIVINLLG